MVHLKNIERPDTIRYDTSIHS